MKSPKSETSPKSDARTRRAANAKRLGVRRPSAAFPSADRELAPGLCLVPRHQGAGALQNLAGRGRSPDIHLHHGYQQRPSYSIDWFKVAGGGGTSTGGAYSLSGAIGQHDAGGPMSGGPYSLTGGFWSLISVAQTPGAPTLSISRSAKTVTVSWQNLSGWSLLQSGSLTKPANWSPSSGVRVTNGTSYLTLAPPAGTLFFRLSKP